MANLRATKALWSRAAATGLAGLLLAAAYVSMQHVSERNSPVWDEMHFWGIGYYLLKTGRFDVPGVLIHPPLSYYLNSLPLLSRDIPLALFHPNPADGFIADVGRGNEL